jgi:hypothetical protein
VAEEKPSEPEKEAISRNKKIRDLAIGFFGWYVATGLIWWVVGNLEVFQGLDGAIFFLIINFLANLLTPIILSAIRRTRFIGLGILAALGLNFLISLVLGTFFYGICFVPFYLR